jgi:MerR family transcriptional regulator, light-induced transcriptional regulator
MNDVDEQKMSDEEPLFNIGAVSRMTDLPETTLRAWERRYQFPRSTRTAGGHRLYSQQEVLRLQWVKKQLDSGMQPSAAIHALRQTRPDEALVPTPSPETRTTRWSSEHSLANFQTRLFETLLAHDSGGASTVLGESLALYSLEQIILDVISPTLTAIGEAWRTGQIDVATEHFATHILRHYLLVWMQMGPPAYQTRPVVLACAPGELHEGSLLMLAVLLRRLRWPVVYLGQSMPLTDLAAFVDELEPSLIVFVAMMEEAAYALTDWPRLLPKVARLERPMVTYGGQAFIEHPELAERVPGILLGKTLKEGVETLDRLLHEFNPRLP